MSRCKCISPPSDTWAVAVDVGVGHNLLTGTHRKLIVFAMCPECHVDVSDEVPVEDPSTGWRQVTKLEAAILEALQIARSEEATA